MGFESVVGKAIAYLDLDTTGFETGIKTAMSQMSMLADSSSTLSQKVSTIGTGMQTVGTSLTRNVTLPIAIGMTAATKKTMDFEQAMSNVAALSGATGDDFDDMHDKALELGAATKFTSKEVADAFSYMALAGWDTTQMLDGISGVLDLAASSDMDLAQASDIVTDYLSAFGLEAKDASKMVDMMAYAQANANTTTTQLGDAFGNSAAFLHTAGQEVNTTTALLSAMANQGLKGSEAGTALSAVMRDIVQKMDDGKIAIGDTNVAVMDSEGNFRDLVDILADVEDATDGMGSAEKTAALMATFTSRSIKGLGTILTEGTDNVKSFRDELDSSAGTASEISEIMLDNLAGSITKLTSALDVFLVKVGERLAPYIRKFADWITDITNKIDSLSDKEFDQIVKIGLIIAAVGPLLTIFGKITTGIGGIIGLFSKLSGAGSTISTMITGCHNFGGCVGETAGKVGTLGEKFKAVSSVIGGVMKTIAGITAVIAGVVIAAKNFFDMWNEGFSWAKEVVMLLGIALAAVGAIILGAPAAIAAVVAAIVAVVATAAVLIHEHWDEIKEWWHNLVESIKEAWDNFWERAHEKAEEFKEKISTTWNSIKEVFNTFVEAIKTVWNNFWDRAHEKVEELKNKLKSKFDEMKQVVKATVEAIKVLWNNFWEKAHEKIDELKQKVKDKVEEIKQIIKEKIEEIKKVWEEGWDKIRDKVEEIKEEIKNKIEEMKEALKNKIEELKNAIIEKFEELKQKVADKIQEMKEKIIGILEELWNNIVSWFENLISSIASWLENVWNNIVSWFENLISSLVAWAEDIWNSIVTWFENMISSVTDWLETTWNNIVTWFTNLIQGIIDYLAQVWDNVTSWLENMWNNIKNWFENLKNNFRNYGRNILSAFWEGLKAIWNSIASWFEEKFSWISNIVDKVKSAASSIFNIGGKVSGSHASGLDYVPYDGYIAQLHKGERVLTKEENKSYGDGNNYSGGDTYNFYNTKDDPYEYARQIKRVKKELEFA